jgi:hypothetical protein
VSLTVKTYRGASGLLTGAHLVTLCDKGDRPHDAADALANCRCRKCGELIGLDQWFHTIDGRHVHAACL